MKTYLAATSRYYWPQMKQEIIKTVESCPMCRELSNDQPARPPVEENIIQRNLEPFVRLCLDQFAINNVQYLVIMDLFRGNSVLHLSKKKSATQVGIEIKKN